MTILEEKEGVFSLRRTGAALMLLFIPVITLACVYCKSDWKVCACVCGIPAVIIIFLLFFTTWEDVSKFVGAARGKKNDD